MTTRSIAGSLWAYTKRDLVILRDPDGSENHRGRCIDIDTRREIPLIEQPGVRALIWRASRDHPTEMPAGSNARPASFRCRSHRRHTGASRVGFENPGYAVLNVNFRGSTGFGKAFVNAAGQEWGGRGTISPTPPIGLSRKVTPTRR